MKQFGIKIFFSVLIVSTSNLYSINNIEYWSNYEISKTRSDKLTFKIKPSFRFNENVTNHYWSSIAVGFDYKINDKIGINTYYRPVIIKSNNDRHTEYRPYLDLILKTKCIKLKIRDRNRIEYLNKKPEDLLRYRNKLSFGSYSIIQNKIDFSIADEIFYDFNENKINLNRIFFNFNFWNFGNPILKLSLVNQQRQKDNCWSNTIIVQTSIVYKI